MCLYTRQLWLRKARKPLKGYKFVAVGDNERFSPYVGTTIPSPCLSGEQCYEPETKSRLEFDYSDLMFIANGGFIHFFTDIMAARCCILKYAMLRQQIKKLELWEVEIPRGTKYALGSGSNNKKSIYWGTCGAAHAIKFIRKIE